MESFQLSLWTVAKKFCLVMWVFLSRSTLVLRGSVLQKCQPTNAGVTPCMLATRHQMPRDAGVDPWVGHICPSLFTLLSHHPHPCRLLSDPDSSNSQCSRSVLGLGSPSCSQAQPWLSAAPLATVASGLGPRLFLHSTLENSPGKSTWVQTLPPTLIFNLRT